MGNEETTNKKERTRMKRCEKPNEKIGRREENEWKAQVDSYISTIK